MQAKLLLALYTALMMPGFVSAQAKTCADFEGVLQNDQVLPLIEFNQRIRSLKLYSDDSLKFYEDGANEDCEMLKKVKMIVSIPVRKRLDMNLGPVNMPSSCKSRKFTIWRRRATAQELRGYSSQIRNSSPAGIRKAPRPCTSQLGTDRRALFYSYSKAAQTSTRPKATMDIPHCTWPQEREMQILLRYC